MERIAPVMARSAVAAEDANFCLHWGFDMAAIREAIDAGGTRGASTIPQQVVKNVYLWHGRSWPGRRSEAGLTPLGGARLVEAAHPRGLSERGRVRPGRLRGGGGGAALFRRVGGGAHAGAGGAARRDPARSQGALGLGAVALRAAPGGGDPRRGRDDPADGRAACFDCFEGAGGRLNSRPLRGIAGRGART
jgi:hypothetical protein